VVAGGAVRAPGHSPATRTTRKGAVRALLVVTVEGAEACARACKADLLEPALAAACQGADVGHAMT